MLVMRTSPGCGEFEFDMANPLFEQIRHDFELLEFVELVGPNLDGMENRPGVYGLTVGGEIVYVGKADRNVVSRLWKHRRQLSGRRGIRPEEVQFRCLYLAQTWNPLSPEEHLIKRYRPAWNSSGFGPNDPGRNRDKTNLKENHWHVRYPLDPDWVCEGIEAADYDVFDLLRLVASHAPYWVRFQGNKRSAEGESSAQYEEAQEDYRSAAKVLVPRSGMTVEQLLLLAVAALPRPDTWQLTQLPSHILLYKERDEWYPRMRRIWPQ